MRRDYTKRGNISKNDGRKELNTRSQRLSSLVVRSSSLCQTKRQQLNTYLGCGNAEALEIPPTDVTFITSARSRSSGCAASDSTTENQHNSGELVASIQVELNVDEQFVHLRLVLMDIFGAASINVPKVVSFWLLETMH